MNVLMVGNGQGSWIMRGQQLGAAMGARVTTNPSDADWRWADLCVLVKMHGAKFAPAAHRYGVPIVWDALDFWRQPADNQSDEKRAKALLQAQITAIKPALVVCATQAMADACGGVYLPHHCWAGLESTPARVDVQTVAYEGNALYLGRWRHELEESCKARGWNFVINPPDLRQADIIVALRDGPWDGWICREWKSGVKVVNAIAAGRPVVSQMTAAFAELKPVGFRVDTIADLDVALASCALKSIRDLSASQVQARALNVQQAAARYQAILASVWGRCVA